MKSLLLVVLFIPGLSKATDLRNFRFIEVKSFKEIGGLPPKLEATFDVMCNEEFIKVIRYEWIQPKSKKVMISIGGMVREDMLSSCAGIKKEIKADAGTTFSGREYEITRIKLN